MLELSISLSIVALIIALVSLCFGIYYFIELKAMQKSTHQIQMVPVDQFGKVHEELSKASKKDYMSEDLDNIL